MGNDGLETLLAYDAVRRKPYRRYRRFYGRRRYRRYRRSRHRGYTPVVIRLGMVDEATKREFVANQVGLVYRRPKPGYVMDRDTLRIRKIKLSDMPNQNTPAPTVS